MTLNICRLFVSLLLTYNVIADLCPEPVIHNGEVSGRKNPDFFLGQVRCDSGFHLLGNPRVKCLRGIWSAALPICTVLGQCTEIERPINGRVIPIRGARHSAYRFACNRGFHLLGEKRTFCTGSNWSHSSLPVCVAAGCQDEGMLDVAHGEARRMLGGAVYRYRCNEGLFMANGNAQSSIFCDGQSWNGTVPICLVTPSSPIIEFLVDGVVTSTITEGDTVVVNCLPKSGNPMPQTQISVGDGEYIPSSSSGSITMTVTEEDSGKEVSCTASNTAGASTETMMINVLAAPRQVTLSGSSQGIRDFSYLYQCSVLGGNPTPEVIWTVKDHEGSLRIEKGEILEDGLASLTVATEHNDRNLMVKCEAVNSVGSVSESKQLTIHYLPKSVSIFALESDSGPEQIQCRAEPAFPAPSLIWKIENNGVQSEEEGEIISHVLLDGTVETLSTLSLDLAEGVTKIECIASIDELGEVWSNHLEFTVVPSTTTTSTTTTSTTTTPEDITTTTTSTTTSEDITTIPPVPLIFGLRQYSELLVGDVVLLTCSISGEQESLIWEVDGEVRGHGAQLQRQGGKVISIWNYVAQLGDSNILCRLKDRYESSALVNVVIKQHKKLVKLEGVKEDEEVNTDVLTKAKNSVGEEVPATLRKNTVVAVSGLNSLIKSTTMDPPAPSEVLANVAQVGRGEEAPIEVSEPESSFRSSPRSSSDRVSTSLLLIAILSIFIRHFI